MLQSWGYKLQTVPAGVEGRGGNGYSIGCIVSRGGKTLTSVLTMQPTPTTWLYLEPRPGSFYRQLFVKGTRIRAEIVYGLTVDGSEPITPEEVAADFNLPMAAVRE